MKVRVAVVGAGMAGLLVAAELLRRGIEDVVVIEAAERAGGIASTIRRNGYELEPGAGTFTLPHPALSPVLEHVGATVRPAAGPGTRYLFDGTALRPIAFSPSLLASPIVSMRGKLRALGEIRTPPSGSGDESVGEFMRRRFGGEAGDLAAWIMTSGVFAGDPERLSVRAAFPNLAGLEQREGSILAGMIRRRRNRAGDAPPPSSYVPDAGMAGLAAAIVERLGDRYRGRSPVGAIRRMGATWVVDHGEGTHAHHVVLAGGADHAIEVLGLDLRPPERSPVVVLGVGARTGQMPAPDGFGILTTPGARTKTLGVLLESSYAPRRAPAGHTLVKIIAGGARHPEVIGWDVDRLIESLGGELVRIFGADVSADYLEIVRHAGIPHYDRGHGEWLSDFEARLEPRIHLAGWEYRGVGLSHLATDARRIGGAIEGTA